MTRRNISFRNIIFTAIIRRGDKVFTVEKPSNCYFLIALLPLEVVMIFVLFSGYDFICLVGQLLKAIYKEKHYPPSPNSEKLFQINRSLRIRYHKK